MLQIAANKSTDQNRILTRVDCYNYKSKNSNVSDLFLTQIATNLTVMCNLSGIVEC